jgi:putative oxidoreductase
MSLLSEPREKWMLLGLRWILGGVFIVAAVSKIIQPAPFATAIANYRLLPHELIHLAAIMLPPIELVAGLLLLAGAWVRASALVVAALTGVFLVAIISALARGLNIECGCFGTVGGRKVGLTALVMDVALLAVAVWLMWRAKARPA